MSEKECPFCGGPGRKRLLRVTHKTVTETPQVECRNCGYVIPENIWNRRPLLKVVEKRVSEHLPFEEEKV